VGHDTGYVLISELTTPALLVERDVLDANLAAMSAALPGPRLRPHVKAHKTTALARRQAAHGHTGFTCATVRECEVMVAAGLGADLLLANEVLAAGRVGALVADGARVTVAVDSAETAAAGSARCWWTSTSGCRGAVAHPRRRVSWPPRPAPRAWRSAA
jgi:D-serine deaminase-like pyridoxal phosphate-dependent protein